MEAGVIVAAGTARDANRVQPRLIRLALLAITAVAAFSYAWRSGAPVNVEVYYAAAARSMAANLHNFMFGSFDPAGTVSTDKLPGAFWPQAVSVRLFGAHLWAVVLPQVIEGALTVLVLYHAVRRLAGPAAGLLAAAVLAIAPATVALNRGNVPDTLMVLLAVLAVDALVTALLTGRIGPALLAGLWIGLAFQAKMVEAWLLLPALAACYLLAGPDGLPRRAARMASMASVAALVSLSWMTVLTVLPASIRPYADGSTGNSLYQQVFVYNGFGRLGGTAPDQLLNKAIGLGIPAPPGPAWNRLLTGTLGCDAGWLLAAAVIAVAAGLAASRGQPRTDPVRACLVLWGTWLVVLFVAFSLTSSLNSYYLGALSPAVAALVGTGLVLAWRHRDRRPAVLAVLAALLATAGYAFWLLPAAGTGLPSWLKPVLVACAVIALVLVLVLVLTRLRARAFAVPAFATPPALATSAAFAAAVVAALLVPAVASVSVVTSGLGPFETPFEPAALTAGATSFFGTSFQAAQGLHALEAGNAGVPYLAATQTAALAAVFIWASGREVLPVGGFTGTIPEPSLATLQSLIQQNDVHTFIQAPATTDPRLAWVAKHCTAIPARTGLPFVLYYCLGFDVPVPGGS